MDVSKDIPGTPDVCHCARCVGWSDLRSSNHLSSFHEMSRLTDTPPLGYRTVRAPTDDGLLLEGALFTNPASSAEMPRTCVLHFSGRGIANQSSHLNDPLARASVFGSNVGFLAADTRGTGIVSMVRGRGKERYYIGHANERFADSQEDVHAWIRFARSVGFENVVLSGHSLGVQRILVALAHHVPDNLGGIVLVSPVDFVKYLRSLDPEGDIYRKAIDLRDSGQPNAVVHNGLYPVAVDTYIDMYKEGGASDVLPLRLGGPVPSLQHVTCPVALIVASRDNLASNGPLGDAQTILASAPNASQRAYYCATGSHTFTGNEAGCAEIYGSIVSSLERGTLPLRKSIAGVLSDGASRGEVVARRRVRTRASSEIQVAYTAAYLIDQAQTISEAIRKEVAGPARSGEDMQLRDIISSLGDPKAAEDTRRSTIEALATYLVERRILIDEGMDWADIMKMAEVVSVEVAKVVSPDSTEKRSLTTERDRLVGGVAENVVGVGVELV